MMKNVFILENSSKFYWGGGQQVTLMVAKILKDEISGLYLADYKSDMLFPQLIKEYIDEAHTIHLLGKRFRNPFTNKESKPLELFISFVTLPLNLFRLRRFCNRNNLTHNNTIIYCITKKVLLLAFFLSLFFKFKYIYHSHMVVSNAGLTGKLLNKELKRSSLNICVSKTVQESIPYPNTKLIYNALDVCNVYNKMPHENFVVSVVGSIVPIKGFDVFVDSYKYLKHDGIEYRIYGSGYKEEELRNIIEENGYDSIKLMGFKKDILSELEETDVLVLPTIIKEASPLVVLQSFLLSIPCIATNIGGQAENIVDGVNGFLVPVKDAKAIAEKINYLFENPDEYKKISLKSHETYSKFTFEKFKVEILDVFRSI